ncbi:MAG TPA: ATPase F0F1 [Gallionella sp.]|nr:MAG: ATPase F0F1 [Gallionellaceae bacterium CG11_big_fil_rev_8_21_14_0_20_60_62]HCJ50621.1 ATPase F0F1 [Gallionella sp.]
MAEPLSLASALIAGILLGTFFFVGLWWTVRRGVKSERVALWFFGSMLLRTSVVMLGFYFVMGDSWQRLLAALLGFVLARLIVTRLTREAEPPGPLAQEADHAP